MYEAEGTGSRGSRGRARPLTTGSKPARPGRGAPRALSRPQRATAARTLAAGTTRRRAALDRGREPAPLGPRRHLAGLLPADRVGSSVRIDVLSEDGVITSMSWSTSLRPDGSGTAGGRGPRGRPGRGDRVRAARAVREVSKLGFGPVAGSQSDAGTGPRGKARAPSPGHAVLAPDEKEGLVHGERPRASPRAAWRARRAAPPDGPARCRRATRRTSSGCGSRPDLGRGSPPIETSVRP